MNADVSFAARLQMVSHYYDKTIALDSVTLDVPASRMVGIIGSDGVGKSTLLALIAGVRQIQSGMVEVLGGDMADLRHRRKMQPRIAYMPQGLGKNLYMDLTVFENIDFFGRLFGQTATERKTRIYELLSSTGLAPFADRPAGKLSGGMKQKLGLCCALIHNPDLLLLDEPTTGVDPLSRRQFWELIARIRAAHPQMSIVIATSYMEEAEGFEWLVAMDKGKVLAQGSPDEIKKRYEGATLEEAFTHLLAETENKPHWHFEMPPRSDGEGDVVISAHDLTMRFGDFTAVEHVSFEIKRGEIFGFLGSNGCGKTTTMKMLTGLLPSSEGKATLFGSPLDPRDMSLRRRIGYMSQSFSLYGELSVWQNLELHARLFRLTTERTQQRSSELLVSFGLEPYRDELPGKLPLGVRQRLSLAVAIIHEPEILILDEPTSGVDPIARDQFWQILADLSREKAVTIFISTHFMNEGQRCDRISLMHAGKVLATGTPQALVQARAADTLPVTLPITLEDAFIAYLQEAEGKNKNTEDTNTENDSANATITPQPQIRQTHQPQGKKDCFNTGRILAYSQREVKEIARDPIRMAFALLGTMILMIVFGYGISMDVEDMKFAVLDYDNSPESRQYVEGISGSRYFVERVPLASEDEIDRRLRSGDISLALIIPPNFGKNLLKEARPEIAAWIDGAMPFRAETIEGYVSGMHYHYLSTLYRDKYGEAPILSPVTVESRFRYNQDFKSIYAMVPSVVALLLLFIPAILTALGVVREKELGSITNLYVTPVTRFEFLLGKQLPYIVIGMANFFLMVLMAIFMFGVPVRGSFMTLMLGAFLYVGATTSMGLLTSTFTRTQIAALFTTALFTMLPAVQFSGMMQPISSLEGAGVFIGKIYPTSHFMAISVGTFTKQLGLVELLPSLLALAPAWPLILLLSVVLLRKQEI